MRVLKSLWLKLTCQWRQLACEQGRGAHVPDVACRSEVPVLPDTGCELRVQVLAVVRFGGHA